MFGSLLGILGCAGDECREADLIDESDFFYRMIEIHD